MKAYGLWLACALAVLLASAAAAQDETPPDRIAVLFQVGMTALAEAEQTGDRPACRQFLPGLSHGPQRNETPR